MPCLILRARKSKSESHERKQARPQEKNVLVPAELGSCASARAKKRMVDLLLSRAPQTSPYSACPAANRRTTSRPSSQLFAGPCTTHKVALNNATHPSRTASDAPCYRPRTVGGFQRARPGIDFSRRSDSIPAFCFGTNISIIATARLFSKPFWMRSTEAPLVRESLACCIAHHLIPSYIRAIRIPVQYHEPDVWLRIISAVRQVCASCCWQARWSRHWENGRVHVQRGNSRGRSGWWV